MKKTKPISPCPCCGNTNLFTGYLDVLSVGVACEGRNGGCGLKLSVGWHEIHKQLDPRDYNAIESLCLKKAIERWNRRQQQVVPTDLMRDSLIFIKKYAQQISKMEKAKSTGHEKIRTTYPVRKIPHVPNAVRNLPFNPRPVKK